MQRVHNRNILIVLYVRHVRHELVRNALAASGSQGTEHSPYNAHVQPMLLGGYALCIGMAKQGADEDANTCNHFSLSNLSTHHRFRVELRAEERLALVSDALVSTVIHVRKERFPSLAQFGIINGVAVVLGSDIALVRQTVHHRLHRLQATKGHKTAWNICVDGRGECVLTTDKEAGPMQT